MPGRRPGRRLLVRRSPGGIPRSRRPRDDHAHPRAERRRRARRRLGRRRRPRPGRARRGRVDPGGHRSRCPTWARCSTPRSRVKPPNRSSFWSTTACDRPRISHRRGRGRGPPRLVAGPGRRRARHREHSHARLVRPLGADRDGRELERRDTHVQRVRVPLRRRLGLARRGRLVAPVRVGPPLPRRNAHAARPRGIDASERATFVAASSN